MASRQQAKEEARKRRLAEEQARAAKAARTKRLQMLSGVVLLAIIIAAVAIGISSSSTSNEKGLRHGKALTAMETSVEALLSGIPQSGNTLGKPNAPVTMTYFGDLECPICQDFTLQGGFQQLVANEVRQGKVKVVYQATCTATCNDHGQSVFTLQQVAALAAGQQDKFWNYAELFYRQQQDETSDYVNDAFLKTLASQIPGLDISRWESDRSSSALVQQLNQQEQSDSTQGIDSTPTLIFTGPKGKKSQPTEAVPSYANLQTSIRAVS